LFVVSAALSGVGAATGESWLTGAALLLASAVSILALLVAGFAVAELAGAVRARRAPAATRAALALALSLALVAAPALLLLPFLR
jgi:hypothetical protein